MKYCLIPQPVQQEIRSGAFSLDGELSIAAPASVAGTAAMLAAALRRLTGHAAILIPPGSSTPHRRCIAFHEEAERFSDGDGAEAYRLTIAPSSVTVEAAGPAGAFYAVQTIIQLAAAAVAQDRGQIPCGWIHDRPRFPWRGLMLDSARHFQPVAWIKRLIDQLALLKLNRLHWHLTDDQGWRAQVERYPRLTQIAAWRGSGGDRYGGFYTQEQMRDIVAYAAARHIQVVPEIEMPGHCNAALYAYPELSCSGKPLEVGDRGWSAYTDKVGRLAFCAGREAVFEFLEGVLDEIAGVFDAPYLHIGGDERPKGLWEQCPRCRAALVRHGLRSESELQGWFMWRMADYCRRSLGRTPILWVDEMLWGDDRKVGLPAGAIAQGWHAGESAQAARLGAATINSNHEWTYFDYPAFERDQPTRPDWMCLLPLEKVYQFDPVPAELEESLRPRVLGSEAAMWTEYTPNRAELEKQLMPRLVAFSEVVWSPMEARCFDEFMKRLTLHQGAGTFPLGRELSAVA
ncbi:MAG TPA: beta-N-acetylhexosaminidase [Phycisphaeraceae bacterium]